MALVVRPLGPTSLLMPQHDKHLPVGAEFETFHSHLSSISIRTHASNTQCSASGLSSNYYPVQMLLNISDLFESDCVSVIGSQAEQVVRISLHHERWISISSRSDCQLKLWSWNSIDRKETKEKKRVAVEWKKKMKKVLNVGREKLQGLVVNANQFCCPA